MANALNVKIGGDIRGLEKALNSAMGKVKDAGRRMVDIGQTLTRNVTLPLLALGTGAVKIAGDFEDSFANIRKTVNATEPEFQAMQTQLRELAKQVPTSVNELNKIGGIAGQLGIANDSIVDFVKTIAMLGDTTDISGEQAALSITRLMNVMGTAQRDIDRMGSTIVGLGNNFAAMESEIVQIGTGLSAFGKDLGLSETEVLSFATAIAASGGEAMAASTAFQKTGAEMKKAVLTGNENLSLFSKTAGMTADAFSKSFRENAAGAITAFLEGLNKIQSEGGSTAVVLEKLGLADQRLQREFGKVTGNIDDLNKAFEIANTSWEDNNALTEEAQKRYETFNSKIKITWNRLKDVGITIGNDLIPHVDNLMDKIQQVTDRFSELSADSRKQILKVAGLFMAGGPLLIGLGIAAQAIHAFTMFVNKRFILITGSIGLAIAAWESFNNSINVLTGKEDKVIGFTDSMKRGFERILGPISDTVLGALGLGDALKELKGLFAGLSGESFNFLPKSELELLKDYVSTVDSAGDSTDDLTESNEKAINPVKNLTNAVKELRAEINKPPDDVEDPFGLIRPLDKMKWSLTQLMDLQIDFSGRLQATTQSLSQGISFAMSIAQDFTSSFGQGMANVLVASKNALKTLKNIGRLLASSVIQMGLKMLLTGGTGGAGGIVGGLFGKIFGVNDALITSKGDVVKFHPDDNILAMKDFSGIGKQNIHVTVSGRLRGEDIFISGAQGEDTFRR